MAELDFASQRARKARLSVFLDSKIVRASLKLVSLTSTLAVILIVLVFHQTIGYLLIVGVALPIVLLAWYAGDLKELPAVSVRGSASALDQILDRKVLGQLKKESTTWDLIMTVGELPGGRFYASRYAIASETLKNLLPENTDINKVWDKSVDIAHETGSSVVDSAIITVALIYCVSEYSFYLAQLHVDIEDIRAGLDWHTHEKQIFNSLALKSNRGGIGRDFSFGWAPFLNKVGVNISRSVEDGILHREIEGHEDTLSQMTHLLSQQSGRNATLVGETGVGKTTLVYAFAERLMNNPKTVGNLRYTQVIELDAAHLISIASGRGELESLLIRLFNEAVHAKNIIIFLDEAQLFLQDGVGSVDLSSMLLQILQVGGLPFIVALNDQQWLKLSQQNPGLAQVMNRVVVSPLNQEDTMRVMQDQILLLEGKNKVLYMFQALREAYNLGSRFIRDQAFPGKAISLLEAAAGFPEQKLFITEKSVQQAVEKNFDVKVQTASDGEERDMLLNLEGRIHERMINQTHAVKVVSDALRRARAGVRNQNKPVGTFLFLGPTGVGKTELSKALADVYFGGEDRLVRVDLNEYSESSDVARLLEVGANNTNSLTAQITKQPFSVVLLDEIEKAHPNVLNVLLQMLDEGMLRDSQNKPVSFRDAVIIATSNAGADKIRKHIESGESLEQFEDQFVDELITSNLFKPEFLNRFDETVLFRPLTVEELTQVVDLIVRSINKTLANQKVSVSLDDDAKKYLAQQGYDPRLGARPLRRMAQRSIENIVAQKLLSGSAQPGTTIQLSQTDISTALSQR